MIRLMLVDDHPLVRDGLRARLSSAPDITVVGEAGDATAALETLQVCQPNLVLMDIGMKDVNGIELTAMLLQRMPGLAIIMLSMYDNVEYAQRALAAGARGYVLKDAPSQEILTALHNVASGGSHISASMMQQLFRAPAPRNLLSMREQDILSFLANGKSSKQIARELDLSVRTVESHRQSIRRKLDLETQADLIKYALEKAGSLQGSSRSRPVD
ncbi:MAG: DNA-binding response regulator [Polaromonas sp.]|nr:DNA-binding response regulator [Polaromonas sp.]